jgi:predicted HTH domain antitoxin
MASTHLDLGDELGDLLAELGQPVEQTAREMIVLEMYRRSLISSGKAAALLDVSRFDFIQRASELWIPYFRFTEEEWQAEVAESKRAWVSVISNSSPLIALAQICRLEFHIRQERPAGAQNLLD